MLVKDWMSNNVITANVNDSMQDAMKLLKENKIRILPVLEEKKLVGIITDGDLKRASASDASTLEIHELLYLLSSIKVKEVMTRSPITVPVDYTIEETAQVLLKNRISGVPVLNQDGIIMGMITQSDLFRVIISLTGVDQKGIQLGLQIEDRPGTITEVMDTIRDHGGRIMSVLSSYELAPEGYRRIYIRTFDIDRPALETITKALVKKAELIYMVDHRENHRTIY